MCYSAEAGHALSPIQLKILICSVLASCLEILLDVGLYRAAVVRILMYCL